MLLSILYSGLFLFTGFSLSDRILHPRRLCVRLWLAAVPACFCCYGFLLCGRFCWGLHGKHSFWQVARH